MAQKEDTHASMHAQQGKWRVGTAQLWSKVMNTMEKQGEIRIAYRLVDKVRWSLAYT